MKIVFFSGGAPWGSAPGGIASYVNHRARLFAKYAKDIEVWCIAQNVYARYSQDTLQWEQPQPFPAFPIGDRWLCKFFFRRNPVWRVAEEILKVDILEYPNGMGALVPADRHAKLIIHHHTSFPLRTWLNGDKRNRLRLWIRNWLWSHAQKHCDAILACSFEIGLLSCGFHRIPLDKVCFLWHYFSPSPECGPLSTPLPKPEKPYFLMIGNLEYLKGFDLLVKAFIAYRKQGGECRLKIAGNTGWASEDYRAHFQNSNLRGMLDRAGLTDDVQFLGTLPKPRLAQYREGAQAVIIASRFEAFTMVAGECFLNGTPLMISNRTGWNRLVERFRGAKLFSPDDCDEFAAAMSEMENEEYKRQLVSGGLQIAEYISGDELAEQTLKFYRKVYENGK